MESVAVGGRREFIGALLVVLMSLALPERVTSTSHIVVSFSDFHGFSRIFISCMCTMYVFGEYVLRPNFRSVFPSR